MEVYQDVEERKMVFYRYDIISDGRNFAGLYNNGKLCCTEYYLVKETPKGYWIKWWLTYLQEDIPLRRQAYWIPKVSKKRLAYPTKKEALESCLARTKRRLSFLKRDLQLAESGLELLKKELGMSNLK